MINIHSIFLMFQDYPLNIPMNINVPWCSNEYPISNSDSYPHINGYIYIYIFHIIFMGISYPISRLSHINVPMKSPWNIRVSSAWLWAAAPHEANAECPVAELDEHLGFKLHDLTKKMISPWKNGELTLFKFNHETWWF